MPRKSHAEADSAPKIISRMPWHVAKVKVLPGFRLSVRFRDRTEGEVDLKGFIFCENPGVFRALQDPKVFAQAGVEYGAVTWPNGLDLAPDAMWDEIKAHGEWIVN